MRGGSKGLPSRRAALAHCSAALALALASSAMTVRAQPSSTGAPRLLIVGDSLSAEYGLVRGTGWVALLEKRLAEQRSPWRVVNASISGDTTSGGRSRLPALLQEHKPRVVVIELGGNDALRGLPLQMTEANLTEMARASRQAGARVLLVGMQLPPNYGRRYGEEFAAVFAKVAQQEKAALVPFLLKGVADVPESEQFFQADRIHPRAEAQPRMLDNVWPVLRPLLK
jgi:acyl-CoA thioesterase-1